ncbi:PKD domain-containing protein, partial [Lentimicrobium sp. L6]|uniref:PKD domain-containing protein n=1 Tax=Lentimicrobium sp. L6 TaxID=2735916 RepID=UPI00155776FE
MKNLYTIIIITTLSLFTPFTFAQGEGNNWYFGDNAALNFATDPPTTVSGSQMSTLEGCASISNQNGELLFYTDGTQVWNRNNVQMPNGFGLKGDASSTQSSVPVPHPGNSDLYYIFTTDSRNNGLAKGFNYSIVDMSANGGLGDIVEKNTRLLGSELVPEKVTAVKHGNEPAFWVITHGWEGSDASTFYVFKIDENGLDPIPQTFDLGRTHGSQGGDNAQARGYLKASPDGTFIACAVGENPNGNIELFDFNDETGLISNYRTVGSGITDPYGVEFSPDGTKMYASSLIYKKLVQIDFSNGNAQTVISSNNSQYELYGALQISPHGTIYMATGGLGGGKTDLPGITNPNAEGSTITFPETVVDLSPRSVRYGLPTFIQSFFIIPSFSFEPTCFEDNTEFTLEVELEDGQEIDFVTWDFNDIFSPDNIQIISDEPYGASHQFSIARTYNVSVEVTLVGGFSFINRQNVTIYPNPTFSIRDINNVSQDPYQLCAGESMEFNVSPWEFESATWSNGASGETSFPYSTNQEISVDVTSLAGCSTTRSIDLEIAPETIVTMELPDFCTGDLSTDISSLPSHTGGTFSGTGITNPTGIIDPDLIPVGESVEITYNYTDANNCNASTSDWVTHHDFPDISFSVSPTEICQNAEPLTLSGGSPNGGIYSGLGVNSTTSTFDPNQTIGLHEITYTYTDILTGCEGQTSSSIEVLDGPEVLLSAIPDVCESQGIITLSQGTPTGGTYSGSGVNSTTGEFDPIDAGGVGTYNITYEFTSPISGCLASEESDINVYPSPAAPTGISASITSYCIADNPGTITLSCTGTGGESYKWYKHHTNGVSIGSSETLSITAPTNTTEYFVRSESENCGDSDAISILITVFESPSASFNLYDECEQIPVFFTDQSSNGIITNWNWDFGDGTGSLTKNPNHRFLSYGTFEVNLTVTTNNNCQSSISQTIEIYDKPSASFLSGNNCLGVESVFTSNSTTPVSSITDYNWDVEGNTYNGSELLYTFGIEGDYDITHEVITDHGCSDSYTSQITILPAPTADFTYVNPCLSNVVELTNISYGSSIDNPIVSYLWEFDNGDTSDEVEPDYIYPDNGTYQINLTVTDGQGCSHTFHHDNIIVFPDFGVDISNNEFCLGEEGDFNGVAIPSTLALEYDWILPGGTFADGQVA